MQDLLLLATLAVMFVFGWFLMKKLDCFLEQNCREQAAQIDLDASDKDPAASEPDKSDKLEVKK